jgi:hypothetical protein
MITDQKKVDDLIVDPTDNYHGRSYGDLVKEFIQWLVQYDPDNQTLRDVVFLRGIDFPTPAHTYSSYSHRFVKIGKDALTVNDGQAIFITLITSFADEVHHHLETPEKRKDYVNQLIEIGDDPPSKNQVSIDGFNPNIDLSDHKIITDDFRLRIPEPGEGKTLGQLLDVPLNQPGDTWTVAGGYFILLEPLPVGDHIIGFYGNGDFGYKNQTLVELHVEPKITSIAKPTMQRGEIQALQSIVDSKIGTGEISNGQDFYKVLQSLESAEESINKIKETVEKQINQFITLNKQQKEFIDRSQRRQKIKQLVEYNKIKKNIKELGWKIPEKELLEILDIEEESKHGLESEEESKHGLESQ